MLNDQGKDVQIEPLRIQTPVPVVTIRGLEIDGYRSMAFIGWYIPGATALIGDQRKRGKYILSDRGYKGSIRGNRMQAIESMQWVASGLYSYCGSL